jgi:hypothetical protein
MFSALWIIHIRKHDFPSIGCIYSYILCPPYSMQLRSLAHIFLHNSALLAGFLTLRDIYVRKWVPVQLTSSVHALGLN